MSEKTRNKPIPKVKVQLVEELSQKIQSHKTVLIASSKGLPGKQFHEIKKKLRDKAEVKVAKKEAFIRAIKATEKGALQDLAKQFESDFAVFFSDVDAFELSGILTDSQSPSNAKEGDIAPEDIEIEPGPTSLVPGPAISELGSVGLKVAVKDGKLEIQKGAVVAKEGEPIKANVASVLGKLGISPMKVGFLPLAAYDSESDKVYVGIKIDKKGAYEELKEAIKKSLGFAISIEYITDKTISYFISKAAMEEKALTQLVEKNSGGAATETKAEEAPTESAEANEEAPAQEEKKEETNDQQDTKEDA